MPGGVQSAHSRRKDYDMAPVIEVHRDVLLQERDSIRRRYGLLRDGFEGIERERELTSDEWLARDELESIDFLIGSD
jgi:hypothetical protein